MTWWDSRTTLMLISGTSSVVGDGALVAATSRSGVPDGARTGLGIQESETNRSGLVMSESGLEGTTWLDGSGALPSKCGAEASKMTGFPGGGSAKSVRNASIWSVSSGQVGRENGLSGDTEGKGIGDEHGIKLSTGVGFTGLCQARCPVDKSVKSCWSSSGNRNGGQFLCGGGEGLNVSASQEGVGEDGESGSGVGMRKGGTVLRTGGLPSSMDNSSRQESDGDEVRSGDSISWRRLAGLGERSGVVARASVSSLASNCSLKGRSWRGSLYRVKLRFKVLSSASSCDRPFCRSVANRRGAGVELI